MEPVSVYMPGSPVVLGEAIQAWVLQVTIGPLGTVSYQVAWYDGNRRVVEWVQGFEVSPAEKSVARSVGFTTGV